MNRSPCLSCERKNESKEKCAKKCERLDAYQRDGEWSEDQSIPGICNKCNEHSAVLRKDGKMVNGLCGFCMSKASTAAKRRKSAMGKDKICDVPGCSRPARARGKCVPCYDKWRAGTLPGQPPFKVIQPQKPRKTRKQKPDQLKSQRPGKVRVSRGKVVETIPESQVIVDLGRYPQLRDIVFETARRLMVTPEHIVIGLVGEALAAKNS